MGEDSGLLGMLSGVGDALLKILPKSPFVYLDMIPEVAATLGYVNYFVPISTCLVIAEGWLTCIGVYYIYSLALRWVKAIR